MGVNNRLYYVPRSHLALDISATTADKPPHVQGHILTIPTQMAGFGRWLPAIDFNQISP